MKHLETEMLLQKRPGDMLIKLKDLNGINHYIYHYCPTKGLIYTLIDCLDVSPIEEVLFYFKDLTGLFLYFKQYPYARMDYDAKQQELTISYKNKHTIIF